MKNKNSKNADEFYLKATQWKQELFALRKLVLKFDFKEEFKWGNPCYTINNKNIVMISTLKNNCVISFLSGALLKDKHNLLLKPGENSRHSRIIKFSSIHEIDNAAPVIHEFLKQAIEISNNSKTIEKFDISKLYIPAELIEKMAKDISFKKAFDALSDGRKRGYCIYFSAPKQNKTRIERIEKYTDRIKNGKGLHDCICGLSKKMPQCDGSHKFQ